LRTDCRRGWSNSLIESPFHKIYRVRKLLIQDPPYRVFLAAVDHVHLRRHTVSILWLRPSSVMRSFSPRPHGSPETHRVGRLLASALPWRCFPVTRRQLQHPRPTADPSVPPFAKKHFAYAARRPLVGREFASIESRINISDWPSGRS
jgi:hypothetical protein